MKLPIIAVLVLLMAFVQLSEELRKRGEPAKLRIVSRTRSTYSYDYPTLGRLPPFMPDNEWKGKFATTSVYRPATTTEGKLSKIQHDSSKTDEEPTISLVNAEIVDPDSKETDSSVTATSLITPETLLKISCQADAAHGGYLFLSFDATKMNVTSYSGRNIGNLVRTCDGPDEKRMVTCHFQLHAVRIEGVQVRCHLLRVHNDTVHSTKSVSLPYIICRRDDAMCDACAAKNQICVWLGEQQTCRDKLTSSDCIRNKDWQWPPRTNDQLWCPGTATTECGAMAEPKTKRPMFVIVGQQLQCERGAYNYSTHTYLKYKGRALHYREAVLVNESDTDTSVEVHFPTKIIVGASCNATTGELAQSYKYPIDKDTGFGTVSIIGLPSSLPIDLVVVTCEAVYTNGYAFKLWAEFIIFSTHTNSFVYLEREKNIGSLETFKLVCGVATVRGLDFSFSMIHKGQAVKNEVSLNRTAEKSTYVCSGTVTYRQCGPYAFRYTRNYSLVINFPQDIEKLLRPNADQKNSAGTDITLYVVIAVVAFFVALAILAVVLYIRSTNKNESLFGQDSPIDQLEQTLRDTDNVLTFATLRRKAGEVIACDAIALTIVESIPDEAAEKAEQLDGRLVKLQHVRYPFIELRLSTRVPYTKPGKQSAAALKNALHMTKTRDYYGYPLYVCQAPLRDQFKDHWQAIWNEKIGLVVLVGAFTEQNERKIEPYFSTIEGGKKKYGNVSVETTAAIKKINQYDQYMIRVKKSGRAPGRSEVRELIFFHVHIWPDHDVPIAPAKLVDFIERLQEHQINKVKQRLPGLLVHCSAGAQRSPALLAVYIGRQIWMRNKKVNVLGILKYLRAYRYKAFGIGNVTAQIQIIFGLLQVIATRTEMGPVGSLCFEAHERDVFSKAKRSSEVEVVDE